MSRLRRGVSDLVRRVLDITIGAVALVVLSPVLVAVALAIRVRMGSPVLFRQRRQGRFGREFELLKFRTMIDPQSGREGPEFDHERITRLGGFLRRTSLDEFPGFINLLRGDITLVGPRPLPVKYWDRYLDAEYVERRSLWLDLRIVARTVPVVLRRHGVDQDGGVTMSALPEDRRKSPAPQRPARRSSVDRCPPGALR
jgi:lipopolysaccharide/colanic/teichoic acid biosynthesis glycosyltransferase